MRIRVELDRGDGLAMSREERVTIGLDSGELLAALDECVRLVSDYCRSLVSGQEMALTIEGTVE